MRWWWLFVACVLLLVCSACTESSAPWTLAVTQPKPWATVMEVFRIALCLATAVLIVLAALVPRRGTVNLVCGMLGAGLAFLAFVSYFEFFNPHVRYAKYYHRHEFFHGFVGAKYFRELGYERLYACSIVAQDGLPARMHVDMARDMADGTVKPATSIPAVAQPELCKRHFSPERWKEFERDIEFVATRSAGSYFDNMHRDSGYGKSPLWTLVAGSIASLFSASDLSFVLLASLDVWLQAGIFVLIWWAFGWRVLLVAAVFWASNAASPFYWTGGAYLLQLWLCLLIAAVCFAKKRRPTTAGALLTGSALLNPYAAVLFGGIGMAALVRLAQRRHLPRSFKRFVAGAVVALGVLIPTSAIATGADSHAAYMDRLVSDSRRPVTNQVGLSYVLSHDSGTRMKNVRNPALSDPFQPWRAARLQTVEDRRPLQLGFVLLVVAWTAWALRRTASLWAAIPLGFPLFMSLMSPTCFHLSMALLLALTAYMRPVLAAFLLPLVATTQIVLLHVYFVDDRYALMTIPLFLAGLIVLCAHSWSWTMQSLRGAITTARPVS